MPVSYGQIIQFQHVKTGKYLARCAHEMVESDSASNKVNLDLHSSWDCWLLVEPRFKKPDEIMKYGDPVVISCNGKQEGQYLQYCRNEARDLAWAGSGYVVHEISSSHGRMSWKFQRFML